MRGFPFQSSIDDEAIQEFEENMANDHVEDPVDSQVAMQAAENVSDGTGTRRFHISLNY